MSIKGWDQVRKHVPAFRTPIGLLREGFLIAVVYFVVSFLLVTGPSQAVTWPLAKEIGFGILGFCLVYLVLRLKALFQARFGELAYSRALNLFGFPGVATIAAVVARIRTVPGPDLVLSRWHGVMTVLGWTAIVAGAALFVRTLRTFGFDYLIMLYAYFPDESHLVEHEVYSLLRHPAYAAAQWVAFGLAALNGNWLGFACALTFALGLWAWVRLVEERELIRRFGVGYADYRRQVPAFIPRPSGLKDLLRFLISGESADGLDEQAE